MRFCACGSGVASVATTVCGSHTGSATANLVIPRYVFAETVMLPAGLIASQGTAAIAATATTTYCISKNGTTAGTMVFAVGPTTATFTMGSATTYVGGRHLGRRRTGVARRDIGQPRLDLCRIALMRWTPVASAHRSGLLLRGFT